MHAKKNAQFDAVLAELEQQITAAAELKMLSAGVDMEAVKAKLHTTE